MRFVVDSSCLISLHTGSVLAQFFALTRDIFTSDFIADELTQPPTVELRQYGLQVMKLAESEIDQVDQIVSHNPRLSLQDASVVVLAQRLEATVLADDRPLRDFAAAQGLAVHGSLWVLEELVNNGQISAEQLCEALDKMIEAGQRLPEEAVRELRKKYGCTQLSRQ